MSRDWKDPRRSEIARLGGRAAQKKGTGHRWTNNTARLAAVKRWAKRPRCERLDYGD